ncbi:MAG: MFS transporter [Planctomycetaceae bacterium]|nr:MFS transporter [Planctomycetaceae bacterium]
MESAGRTVKTREIVAWALCDWANSAYSTLLITIVVVYLQKFVLPDDPGILAYGWGLGVSMFISAWLSPILGAMADARANKRTWLLCTSYTGAACSVLMGLVPRDWQFGPVAFVALFFLASLAFELSFSFYNGFLPEIADEESMNRVSGYGYAAGYFGGGLALAVAIAVLMIGSSYGLSDETGLRLGLVIMGLWWAIFTLPAAFILRDRNPPRGKALGLGATAQHAIGEVLHTLSRIRSYSVLALFLLGFLLYNEGIQTVMSQASVFAQNKLGMKAKDLAMVVLMIQFVATPAALGVGWLGDRIGAKTTLLACLTIWCGLLVAAFFTTTQTQFWYLGVVLAMVMGGTQSISRAVMGSMTPTAKTAEFFGFFNLSCRATSMFGPILFAQVFVWTDSANLAILSLLIFIVAGMTVVLCVNLPRGIAQAKAD